MQTSATARRPVGSRRTWRSVAAFLLATGCATGTAAEPEASFYHSTGPRQGTFYGAAVRIGDGVGRTYITVSDGAPIEIGIALSESALQRLPAGPGHSDGSHAHFNEYLLPLHPQNPSPFDHAVVNWNAQGHEPEEIYGLPHFDFHFYHIPPTAVEAIHPSNPDWSVKANRLPPPELIPENYVSTHVMLPDALPEHATVPRMGLHWADVTSPELHGATFTETFIYGSWDGEIIFLEPMITRAFLKTRPDFRRVLPRALQGYNPGSYRVYWHEARREYRIALSDLPQQP